MASPSLIQAVLGGDEHLDRILIQDTVAQSGRGLLKHCLCHLVQRYTSVHLFLFDTHYNLWSHGIQKDTLKRVKLHDCYSDALGWNSDKGTPHVNSGILTTCSLQSYLERLGRSERDGCAVVFDSLSPLLLHHAPSQVCRLLYGLGSNFSTLLCLVHTDLHKDHVIAQLGHVMSTSIVVRPVERDVMPRGKYSGVCSVQHKMKTGKILKKMEAYTISESFTSLTATDCVTSSAMSASESTSDKPALDPSANLTFDLRLSIKEKEDRANVVLPYTAAVPQREVGVATDQGGGQIFYQPDEVDDFDESDPDDDLDF